MFRQEKHTTDRYGMSCLRNVSKTVLHPPQSLNITPIEHDSMEMRKTSKEDIEKELQVEWARIKCYFAKSMPNRIRKKIKNVMKSAKSGCDWLNKKKKVNSAPILLWLKNIILKKA